MEFKRLFLRELTVIFSFISGLFSAIGFTPEAKLFGFIRPFMEALPFIGSFLFALLPSILLVISMIKVYRKGRFMGIFAVAIGFFSGLIFPSDIFAGIIIFAFGLFVGYLAFKK